MKKPVFWIILFTILFLLTQDFIFWEEEATLGFMGFPTWIFWIVFWEILMVIAIYLFSKKYWK